MAASKKRPSFLNEMERAMGLEPSTFSLGSWDLAMCLCALLCAFVGLTSRDYYATKKLSRLRHLTSQLSQCNIGP